MNNIGINPIKPPSVKERIRMEDKIEKLLDMRNAIREDNYEDLAKIDAMIEAARAKLAALKGASN